MATFAFEACELDEERFELRRSGRPVPIQPKVLSLLLLLVREAGRMLTKKELLAKNWPGVAVTEASLARAVKEVRKAINDDAHKMLVTVQRTGFRFAAPVRQLDAGPPPALIGRDTPVAALRARLDAASNGHGSVAWLVGEAGIGKTRVVEELARIAEGGGIRVVTARCHETPASPPSWVWAQLVRRLVEVTAAERPPSGMQWLLEDDPGAHVKDLARFDAFARELRAAAARATLLLVLEDVQSADDSSLALLGYVAREIAESRVLLVATYRDVPAVGHALAGAIQTSRGVTIPLRALGVDEVARVMEAFSGAPPPEAVARRLHEKSGGNPLYLRELLGAGWAEHAGAWTATSRSTDLSDTLQASVARHLDGVSPECRETLSLAALLGQRFDFSMLAAASQLPEGALLDRLAEAIRARLVEKTSGGEHRFRHALVRNVLYRSLTGAHLAEKHASIAALLDAHWGAGADAHAEELAYHYVRALPRGDARRALAMSVRAADHLMTRGSYRRAASHFQQAIHALKHLPAEEPQSVQLHLSLARAWVKLGASDRATETFLDAAVLANAFRMPDLMGQAALGFAAVEGPLEARKALLVEARAALADAPGPSARDLREQLELSLAKM